MEPENLVVLLARQVGLLALLAVPYTLLFESRIGPPVGRRLAFGAIAGLIAVFNMMAPIMVTSSGYAFDGRSAVCLLTALYGGPLSGIVAGSIAAFYRWWIGGPGVPVGVMGIAGATAIGIVLGLTMRRRSGRRMSAARLAGAALVLTAMLEALALLLPDREMALRLMRDALVPLTAFNLMALLFTGTLLERERRRHEAEAVLEERNALHRLITESANDIILKIDHEWRVSYVSHSVCEVLGYDPGGLLGRDVGNLIHEERGPKLDAIRRGLGEAGDCRLFTLRVRHATGKPVWMEIAVRRVMEPGKRAPVLIAVARDVSRRKQAEAELLSARFQAEAANRAKSSFLAAMSHELRTPLNAIIGFSEMIERELLGPVGMPAYRDYAGDIRNGGQHLLTIVNNILDLSKIEAGRIELDEQPTDLARLVFDIRRLMGPQAEAAGVAVGFETGYRHLYAVVDETRFKQILMNLVSNAIKFTPRNGSVAITLDLDEEGAPELTVSDTGIGIEAEDIPLVLEPFGQVRGDVVRTHNGTGLGLPLARHFTQIHGGTFRLDSVPGLGTRISVRLPASRLRLAEPAARPEYGAL